MRVLNFALPLLLAATTAAAQQRPFYAVDDFVDPREHDGAVFASRLVLGAAKNVFDEFRPAHRDAAFVQVASDLYLRHWQLGYDHTEMRSEEPRTFRCNCSPPIYFPTPPPPGATPAAPQPGARDALRLGLYRQTGGGPGALPIMLRYSLTVTRQRIDTPIRSASTLELVDHRHGHEQSIGLDADTHLRILGREVWGSLAYARTSRSGTIDNRVQQGLAYTARPPGWAVGRVLARATLTVAAVSGRGGTAIDAVNPALEAFWHSQATRVNLHLVWSPQLTNSAVDGWRARHQLALFADYPLIVRLFR